MILDGDQEMIKIRQSGRGDEDDLEIMGMIYIAEEYFSSSLIGCKYDPADADT